MKTLLAGLRFGMLLQLAVGPVCLFVFTLANREGFAAAEFAVLGIVLADAIFVLAAIAGIAPLLDNEKAGRVLAHAGAAVVLLFGIEIILSSLRIWSVSLPMPRIAPGSACPFLRGFLLTASNPLTILFWTGVFSSRISSENPGRKGVFLFASGAVMATPVFLTAIAAAGTATSAFLPLTATDLIGAAAGLFLVLYALNTSSGGRIWNCIVHLINPHQHG